MALSLDQYKYTWMRKINEILTKRAHRQRKRLPIVSFKNGNRMPEEILVEILSRMPVKDLLQFKSVCKSWYNIIKSPYFISKHLENYYNNQSNWGECLIVQYAVTPAGEINVYELLLNEKKNTLLCHQEIRTPLYNTYMCGPCNGIYYMWCISPCPKQHSFWNPSLDEFEVLPSIISKPNLPSFAKANSYKVVYGFGYDLKTEDYKAVVIHNYLDARDDYFDGVQEDFEPFHNTFSVFIYSLRANSWRYWGDLNKYLRLKQSESYNLINGCYYWLGSRHEYSYWAYDTVISFDFTNDAITEIPMPQFTEKPYYGSLIVYDESIAYVCVPQNGTGFCVWTWKSEVWTQQLKIELDFKVRNAFSHWKCNMLIFGERSGMLRLYDTETKETWALDDPQAGSVVTICAYKESLVSIKDFKLQAQQEVKIIEPGLNNILSVKLYCDGLLLEKGNV